jgi:hypothetical protein
LPSVVKMAAASICGRSTSVSRFSRAALGSLNEIAEPETRAMMRACVVTSPTQERW